MSYLKRLARTPQSTPMHRSNQTANNATAVERCLAADGARLFQFASFVEGFRGFSIADPQDPGMLDVVGFDTATPQLDSDFARGAL